MKWTIPGRRMSAPATERLAVAIGGHEYALHLGAGAGIDLLLASKKVGPQGRAIGVDMTDEMIAKAKRPTLEQKHKRVLDGEQTRLLLESGAVAIAYETVTDERGGLPLLAPMSEVAGRMAVQAGAHALEKAQGGAGVLRQLMRDSEIRASHLGCEHIQDPYSIRCTPQVLGAARDALERYGAGATASRRSPSPTRRICWRCARRWKSRPAG